MNTCRLVIIGTALALASGCAEVSKKAGELSDTVKAAVGSKPSSSAPTAGAEAPPQTSPTHAPVAGGTARPTNPPATPAATARPATGQPAVVAVGRSRVPIASVELDKYCSQVVAPYDLSVNMETLAPLAMEATKQSLGAASRGSNTHVLSKPLREEAMRMNWLPMSVEKRYGAMLHEESVKRKALLTREERIGKELYPIADKLFARVLQGVPQSAYTFELYIRKSNEGNAIALPGGFVYIDSILLQSPKSFPEAHFALSHEVGHVLQRHETRIAQARIIDTLSLAGSAKDLLVTIQDPSKLSDTVLAVAAKGKGIFQKHFEGQELQADACAVRILDTAFDQLADVDAALNAFIQSLAKSTQASGAKPVPVAQVQRTASPNTDDLLQEVGNPIDRHPSFTERVANLGAMRKAIAVQRATGKR